MDPQSPVPQPDEINFEKLQCATTFLTQTLKNYKLYKDNEHLYSRVYSCCDCCYQIRPLWNDKKLDHYNKSHDIILCSDCFVDVPEDSRSFYSDVTYKRDQDGGLFVRA
jgi:hypothetical protein